MSHFSSAQRDSATELLKALIRIDTSNPPGNVAPAMELLRSRFEARGITSTLVGESPEQINLVAKIEAPEENRKHRPLILSCHLDVVPADAPLWTHPPFSAHDDGTCIWGRGAIDMKGFAAMAAITFEALVEKKANLNRDVIFVAVCDEEAGTKRGSKWLVENHPDLLGNDPEYVINEVGGFTVHRKGRRFYPVQVAEKGVAWLRLTVKGTPGHSSLPGQDNAAVTLARAVQAIDKTALPWHPSEEAARFIDGFAAPEGTLAEHVAALFLNPEFGPGLLRILVTDKSRRASLEAVLRNTANTTRLSAGEIINVIPSEAHADIDGRLAPGQTAEDLIRELETILDRVRGCQYSFEVLQTSPPVSFQSNTPLFHAIEEALESADPGSHVVPSIIQGFTDSKNYATLGATCYGFYPLKMPEDLDFASLFHGINERIPIEGFHWGCEVLTTMLGGFLHDER